MAGFSQELELAGAPATGNINLLAAAGQSRGQAAEIGGKATAGLVETLGKTAVSAGVAKGEAMAKESVSALDKEVADVASKTILPDQMYAGSEIASTIFVPKEEKHPSLQNSSRELSYIKSGTDQGRIKGNDAAIMTEAIIKKYGAINPHLLTEYRKQAAETWQTSVYGQAGKATYDLLATKQKEDAAAKAVGVEVAVVSEWATKYFPNVDVGNMPRGSHNYEIVKRSYQSEQNRLRNLKLLEDEKTKVKTQVELNTLTVGPELVNVVQAGRSIVGGDFLLHMGKSTLDKGGAEAVNVATEALIQKFDVQYNNEMQRITENRSKKVNGVPYDTTLLDELASTATSYRNNMVGFLRDKNANSTLKSNLDIIKQQVSMDEYLGKYVGVFNKLMNDNPVVAQQYLSLSADLLRANITDWQTKTTFSEAEMKAILPHAQKQGIPTWNSFLEIQNVIRTQDSRAFNAAQTRLYANTDKGSPDKLVAKALDEKDPIAQLAVAKSVKNAQTVSVEEVKTNPTKQKQFVYDADVLIHTMNKNTDAAAHTQAMASIKALIPKIDGLPEIDRKRLKVDLAAQFVSSQTMDGGPVRSIIAINKRFKDAGLGDNVFELMYDPATQRTSYKSNYNVAAATANTGVLGTIEARAVGATEFENAEKQVKNYIASLNTNNGWLSYLSKELTTPMTPDAIAKSYIRTINDESRGITGTVANLPMTSPVGTPIREPAAEVPTSKSNPPNASNPLNLIVPGKPGNFQRFPTQAEGIKAAAKQLTMYSEGTSAAAGKKKLTTLSEITSLWNNEKELGSTNSNEYLATVQKHSGLDPKAKLDLANPKIMGALIYGMSVAEGNKLDPKLVMASVTQPTKSIYEEAGKGEVFTKLTDYTSKTASQIGVVLSAVDEAVFGSWRDLVAKGLMAEKDYREHVKAKINANKVKLNESSVVPREFK